MHWILPTLCVCLYGFFIELRPSETYLSVFLNSTWHNLTLAEINGDVFPWWNYSYLAGLIPVSLLSDYVRYKPLFLLDALLMIVSFVLLIWANGVNVMKLVQICSGLSYAADTVYHVILYSLVDKRRYKLVTSLARTASLLSKCVAGICGQILVSCNVLDLKDITFCSLTCVSLAFITSLLILTVKEHTVMDSTVTHTKQGDDNVDIEDGENIARQKTGREYKVKETTGSEQHHVQNSAIGGICLVDNNVNSCSNNKDRSHGFMTSLHTNSSAFGIAGKGNITHTRTLPQSAKGGRKHEVIGIKCMGKYTSPLVPLCNNILHKVRSAYSGGNVLLWSSWTIFGSIGSYDRGIYIQNLWTISPMSEESPIYNGAIKASETLIVLVAMVVCIPIQWSKPGRSEVFMVIISVVKAVSFGIVSQTGSIWLAYMLSTAIGVTIQVSLTLQSGEIANSLSGQAFGFVHGCNLFCGLFVDTVFTAVVVDRAGIGVNVRTQFLLYGMVYSLLTVVLVVYTGISLHRAKTKNAHDRVPRTRSTESVNSHTKIQVWSTTL